MHKLFVMDKVLDTMCNRNLQVKSKVINTLVEFGDYNKLRTILEKDGFKDMKPNKQGPRPYR